jgi:acetyl-CoA carboxylase biotin carboxyl carrier protein
LSQEELEQIRQYLKVFAGNSLAELEVKQPNGVSVKLAAESEIAAPAAISYGPMIQVAPPVADAVPTAAPAAAAKSTGRNPKAIALESPMVGTYYRAQTPSDPPFVKDGDIIAIGQTIGLIEAMKVYSEIPSEHAGRVIEINATNGQLVQLGQPLMYVEPI